MKNIIVVCEYGWIICGIENGGDANLLELSEASIVRTWTNGRGIGGLASEAYKDDYTLDEIGDVIIRRNKILFTIPCEW